MPETCQSLLYVEHGSTSMMPSVHMSRCCLMAGVCIKRESTAMISMHNIHKSILV